MSRADVRERLDRLYNALKPIFYNGDLRRVKLTAEDVAAVLILAYAFDRAAPARDDWTDTELTELEAHADRLVRICPIKAKISPTESV